MNYRTDLIYPAQANASASGTVITPIKSNKPISRIEMTYKTTKVLSYMTAGAPANIPKIELVDGSIPLHSLTGYVNQALAYYSRPTGVMSHGQHIRTQSEMDIYALDFGRFLHDPLLAFDPTKFANPQLKVTYNQALADTSCVADSLEIWAELFDDLTISPIGFLSAREIWSGTLSAAASVNEVAIPDDQVIRQILLRANIASHEPWYNVSEVKFDEAGSGKVIFDYPDAEMYYRRMKGTWRKLEIPIALGFDGGSEAYYLEPTDYNASIDGVGAGADGATYLGGAGMAGGVATIHSTAGANLLGVARGYLPWSTFQYPLGNQQDIGDWYDASGKKPRIRFTSYTGGGTALGNLAIETVHKY